MAGFGFDSGSLKASGKSGDMYLVIQVVLTQKFIEQVQEYQVLLIFNQQ